MITIVAAVSSDGFIGRDGKVPWKLSSDMEHFRQVTTTHTVIMGRKTWDSLPAKFRPLPDRKNIVLSRQAGFYADGAEVISSLKEALELTTNEEQVFIIGGGEVYWRTMSLAERLLITRVHQKLGHGDTRFPPIHPKDWNLVSSTPGVRTKRDEYDFTIEDYSPNLRYIELANTRGIKMLQEYRLIRQRGHCPFCTENLALYHNNPILWEGTYWLLSQNDYPYAGTKAHLILILKEHAESVGALSEAAWQEFHTVVRKLEEADQFPGGGVCMRAGDPLISGASVKHLHAHIISPMKERQIAFYMGRGKR